MREQQDPAARLGAAAARYVDALHLAAEHLAGQQVVASLDRSAERLLNGLTGEPAWPTLRGHLLLLAAAGADPVADCFTAAATRDLIERPMIRPLSSTGGSRTSTRSAIVARCRGCRAFPTESPPTRNWGPYLDARSQLVAELADQVRLNAAGEAPAWAAQPHALVPAELIADVQVWRAATQVDPSDLRPTGPPQLGHAARAWQQQLDKRLAAADTNADWRWRQLLATEVPSATADPFLPELEERLSNLTRAGFDATLLVRSAAAAGPLPDDHPAAALWWRILDQLPRKRRTRTRQPPTPSQRPGARARRHTTSSHPCRARHRLPRSARAAET